MARISMRSVQKSTFEQTFSLYLSAAAAKGVKDKLLNPYKQHFREHSVRVVVLGLLAGHIGQYNELEGVLSALSLV